MGEPQELRAERRRSMRVLLAIAVKVSWKAESGEQVKEEAETEEVNAHGAILRMKTQPPATREIELVHCGTGSSSTARVVALRNPTPEGLHRVAVELSAPVETFWGISILAFK